MKKLVRLMALALMVMLMIGGLPAMAEKEMSLKEIAANLDAYTNWDVVIKKAKLYSDKACTHAVGTIPAWTVVRVESYRDGDIYAESNVTRVFIGGKAAYIRTNRLLQDAYPARKSVTLPKGTTVYQRPNASSAHRSIKKSALVWVCAVKNGWALVRTEAYDYMGVYAFVRVR